MCGFAGQITVDPSRPVSQDLIRAMTSRLAHRGPDGEGFWFGRGIGLGHRRLSIIDLNERAAQPMIAFHEGFVTTFNGEIYNFKELRDELTREGFRFRTESDTEVLLHGYERWGIEGLLTHLGGMFAFALFDVREDLLFLCRDRFGKKPLYYHYDGRMLTFASESPALTLGLSPLPLDNRALDFYLTELSVPQPLTIWRGVHQVRPAHTVRFQRSANSLKETPYWTRCHVPKRAPSLPEVTEELDRRLANAVVQRTVADVPVGALLSGGLDSGLVVSLLATYGRVPVRTFSVSFGDPEFDEAPLARRVAEKYRAQHVEIRVEADAAALLPRIVTGFGEPFADSSAIPTFLISQEISRHVKVVLSGEGGDELFGYPEYGVAYLAERHVTSHPGRPERFVLRALDRIRRLATGRGEYVGYLQDTYNMPGADRLYRTMGFSWRDKRALYSPEFVTAEPDAARAILQQAWDDARQESLVDTLVEAGFGTRLLNDYLVKVDRAAMMNSLEIRSPFLDHELAGFSLRVSNDLKFAGGRAKFLLRHLARRYLDPAVIDGPKRGFAVPLARWLRKGRVREMASDLFASRRFRERGMFNMTYVDAILKAHASRAADHSHRIWVLLCLELWCRIFLDDIDQ